MSRSLFETGGGAARLTAGAEKPEHDFGLVLAGRKVLRHEFVLSNPTNRPVRLLRAEARTPCCSKIGPLPESIAPGGKVKVPITFNTGYETGFRRVEFVIVTDSSRSPVWTLGVRARCFAEFEVEREGDASLTSGKTGKQTLHVICRRRESDGLIAPIGIDVRSPLESALVGPGKQAEEVSDGLIRTTRVIEVRLPSIAKPGPQRQEILLRWDGHRTETYLVNWTVTAPIMANPPGLVIRSSEGLARRTI